VPVLWDKKEGVIVNNESLEILRMFNASFNNLAKNPELDLYPEALRAKIDEVGLDSASTVIGAHSSRVVTLPLAAVEPGCGRADSTLGKAGPARYSKWQMH